MKASLLHWTEPRVDEKKVEGAASFRKTSRLKRAIRARLDALLDRIVPVGYQDEGGFHYGEQRRP